MIRDNVPLAGADAFEWGSRNVDRFILGVMFEPKIVGIYYMAQQVASLPQKLKTSFDPILGPVITQSLAVNDRIAIANQVRQVAFWIIAAQLGLALMGSIPGEAVMGVVGPQFVVGTAALAFLLTAEVLASTGAVCETALVYVARHRNLAISAVMLAVQVALSFALIMAMRTLGWSETAQAAGPALALMASMALTSVIKARVLGRILGAPVSPLRWPLLWAALVAGLVGGAFTTLPHRFEWAEIVLGEPAMAATYLFVLWKWAFGPADRALFARTRRRCPTWDHRLGKQAYTSPPLDPAVASLSAGARKRDFGSGPVTDNGRATFGYHHHAGHAFDPSHQWRMGRLAPLARERSVRGSYRTLLRALRGTRAGLRFPSDWEESQRRGQHPWRRAADLCRFLAVHDRLGNAARIPWRHRDAQR
jgi:hypothetical protein